MSRSPALEENDPFELPEWYTDGCVDNLTALWNDKIEVHEWIERNNALALKLMKSLKWPMGN